MLTKPLTNASQNQESSHEPPKVHRRVAGTVHKIIGVRTSCANPIGERRNDVNGDHQQWPVLVPERGGEDNEEKADCQDLQIVSDECSVKRFRGRGRAHKGKRDDGLESSRHDCGVAEAAGGRDEWNIGVAARTQTQDSNVVSTSQPHWRDRRELSFGRFKNE